MLTMQAACQIISVGEVKKQKGFKKCFVLVRTKEQRDPDSNEVTRKSGDFECEVALSKDHYYTDLCTFTIPGSNDGHTAPDAERPWLPCHFVLRSFTYTEKNVEKLGKQLQLKRWWR